MERSERRRKRSGNHVEAVRLYLEALAIRHRLEALVLADQEGFLVSCAGSWADFEHLALLAAIGADQPARVVGLLGESETSGKLLTCVLNVDGVIFYLASVGLGSPAFEDVTGTINRILFEAA